jgi:hypothetical protein
MEDRKNHGGGKRKIPKRVTFKKSTRGILTQYINEIKLKKNIVAKLTIVHKNATGAFTRVFL